MIGMGAAIDTGESDIAQIMLKSGLGIAALLIIIFLTVTTILYPMDNITEFLYLIGSVFAPMIAIQIEDFFILKKDSSKTAANFVNLMLWLAGFILYRMLMRIDIPVGNTLPCMAAAILLCIAVYII